MLINNQETKKNIENLRKKRWRCIVMQMRNIRNIAGAINMKEIMKNVHLKKIMIKFCSDMLIALIIEL